MTAPVPLHSPKWLQHFRGKVRSALTARCQPFTGGDTPTPTISGWSLGSRHEHGPNREKPAGESTIAVMASQVSSARLHHRGLPWDTRLGERAGQRRADLVVAVVDPRGDIRGACGVDRGHRLPDPGSPIPAASGRSRTPGCSRTNNRAHGHFMERRPANGYALAPLSARLRRCGTAGECRGRSTDVRR